MDRVSLAQHFRWWGERALRRLLQGLVLGALVLGLGRCGLPTEECDRACQQNWFPCFRQLRTCDDVCSLGSEQTIKCVRLPAEPGEEVLTITRSRADCQACRNALASWQQGGDCRADQARCVRKQTTTGLNGYLLQKCVVIQGRWTWSEGRRCDAQDKFPCLQVNNKMQCVGCGVDSDCGPGEQCDTVSRRCVQCASDADCASPTPYCDISGRCVACTIDTHCQSAFTGHFCVDGACICEQDSDCQAVGFPSCAISQGACQSCTSNNDCSDVVFGRAICSAGRCLSQCSADEDCEKLINGVCMAGRCLPGCEKDFDCEALGLIFCENKRCLQCLRHNDCPATKPFCHPSYRTCTECLRHFDCPDAKPVCNPRLFFCTTP